MSPDSEGLYEIAGTGNPRRQADVIFIHGVAGASHSTWRHGKVGKPGHFFWPEELGKDLPVFGIWSIGYPAGITELGEPGMIIDQRAGNISDKLSNGGLGDRPILFITHSMGGLIVKSLIVRSQTLADPDRKRLVRVIRGIVFCATPHRGSGFADAASVLGRFLGGSQDHVREMRANAIPLDILHSEFLEWHRQHPIPVLSYAENIGLFRKRWFLRPLPLGPVVPRPSANPGIPCHEVHDVGYDHLTIVKPPDRSHDVYAGVLRFIRDALTMGPVLLGSEICDSSGAVQALDGGASSIPQAGTGHFEETPPTPSNQGKPGCGRSASIRVTRRGNPFQTAGALSHNHPTYIRRTSDTELERLLQGQDRLISITGDFGIGKSSLMQQSRRILPGYRFFGEGLAGLGGHDETLFMNNIFRLFGRSISSWEELEDLASQSPSVLFLDDIGEVPRPGLQALIPALVCRLTQCKAMLRAIATCPQKLQTLFAERGLSNPKYSEPWKNVLVHSAKPQEAKRLLEPLPPRARALAEERFDLIEQRSQLRPQRLQRLCYLLFEAECGGATSESLRELIATQASYE